MNPNNPEAHDCPYDQPAEQARLRSLVDSMNVLIRHHQSLAGAETAEDVVKSFQKLLLRAGLPAEAKNRLMSFYLGAQLKAAQQGGSLDIQAMDAVFQEAMEVCLEPEERDKLKDLAERTRALIGRRLEADDSRSSKGQLKKDLLAINNANPVHWRVRNFFRKKIREGVPAEPMDFKAVLKELKKDWGARQNTAEIRESERRKQADKILNSIRADLQMERHIREVLRTPAVSKKKVDIARAAEQALIHQQKTPLPETKPQISFPGDMVQVDEAPSTSPETETAFPPLTGIPLEEFSLMMEKGEAVAEVEPPEIPITKKDLLSRQFPKIIGPEKHQWNGLMMATFTGNENSVRRFLRQGIDVNEADETGYTPLMLAAENDFGHIVEVLIEHKADLTLKDKKGETALDKARQMGHEKIIAFLESIEFKVKSTRKQIRFPDHEAAEKPVEMKEASNAEEAFEWGNDASRKGDYELARQYFEQAITIDPDFSLAYKHLGYVLEQLGELKLSAEYHRTATEMESRSLIKSARQAVQKGDNFNNQNDFEKALECYKKVFTYGFDPTPDIVVMAYFGMGQVYLKKNELEPAKEHFRKILKIEPKHFDACRYLGYIFHRENNLEAAKIWYNKALESQPDNEWVKDHLKAIWAQEAPRSSSGDTLEEAFAGLAVQQQQKEAEFQATMGESKVEMPEDMLMDGSGDDSNSFHAPDIGKLSQIGFPVETDGLPPPPIPPDAADLNKDVFDFIPPAVRGQNRQLGEEVLEQKRIRARKRLKELYQVIACKEYRTAEELDEAVKGYVALVKQPKLSCIEGVDHRGIAIALRNLWREEVLKDFTPVEMAHAQDLAVSHKLSETNVKEYFMALAEYGKSCFETRTFGGFKKAGFFFFRALEIDPKPKGKYVWVRGFLEESKKWIQKLEKQTKEQPVRIEEDFENTLRPPTIVNQDIPEAVREEAQEGMGIFISQTRKFMPGVTKIQPQEPRTVPRAKSLEYRLKEQMGDLSAEPVTQKNINIPEETRRSDADEFDRTPPTMPAPHILDEVLGDTKEDRDGPEVADNPEFRRQAQILRHQYLESGNPAQKTMLQTTIYKYHYDDINFHRRKSAVSYLELGISLIAFKDKPRAKRALSEAWALVRQDQKTLKEQIHEWLGKLEERAV